MPQLCRRILSGLALCRLEQGLAQYLIKGAAWLRERGPMLMVTSQVPFTNFLIPAGVE